MKKIISIILTAAILLGLIATGVTVALTSEDPHADHPEVAITEAA